MSSITEMPRTSKARHPPRAMLAAAGMAVHTRARCVAVVMAGMIWGMAAVAQTPAPGAPTATGPQAAATRAPTAQVTPSKNAKPATKRVVSPYARAAAQHEHAGEAPAGHAPTMVQGMGMPHKPHAAAKK